MVIQMRAMNALEICGGKGLIQIEADHFRAKRGVEWTDLEILNGICSGKSHDSHRLWGKHKPCTVGTPHRARNESNRAPLCAVRIWLRAPRPASACGTARPFRVGVPYIACSSVHKMLRRTGHSEPQGDFHMGTVARFEIGFTRYLSAEGAAAPDLPEFARDPAALLPLYRAMVLTRQFDLKAIAMQRTGQIGTFASALGQEAIGVGVASAMRAEDVLVPSYRDHAAQFVRGVTMTESLLYWGGDERGSAFSAAPHDFGNCVPIGTQVGHAAGVAYACKLRGEARVAVCILGDGGTSTGDFYEGMNMAGAWQVPLVIVVNNNQWAISMPRARQTAAPTLAQKAIAAGIPGEQVDGNDIVAVRHRVGEAIERARSGSGPTLIEAVTYRLSDHTTADDASRYRDEAAVKEAWRHEPITRLRSYLASLDAWDAAREEALVRECQQAVGAAVDAYLKTPLPNVSAMFDCLYETLPAAMADQLDTAQRYAAGAPETHHG